MHTATVSTKGWVVIPKELRKKYKLTQGTRVQVVEYGNVLVLVPLSADPITALHGMLADGPSLTNALLMQRKQDYLHEENKGE